MRRILLSLLCMVSLSAYAQHAVVVNPDGTHSVVINNGNSATKDNSKWKKWWTRKYKNKKKGSSINDQPAY